MKLNKKVAKLYSGLFYQISVFLSDKIIRKTPLGV